MGVVDREWRRHSPGERIGRFALLLAIVMAIVWSVRTIEIIPEFLADAPEQMLDLLKRMWPVDVAHYPRAVHAALIETLHIATLGTVLSLVMAVPVALCAARNICARVVALGELARLGARVRRDVRARRARRHHGDRVPLDRLRWEAPRRSAGGNLERLGRGAGRDRRALSLDPRQGLLATGGAGLLGHRAVPLGHQRARVLGLVGAGGIGVVLDDAMNFFQWERVAMVLLAIFAVVLIAEVIVNMVRKRLI
jgi:phosphonate transport system permease protein